MYGSRYDDSQEGLILDFYRWSAIKVCAIFALCVVCWSILSSCSQKDIKRLPQDEAAVLFLDVGLADQIVGLHPPEERDSVKAVLVESLLKIHKLSQEELEANFYLYMSDFEAFDELTKEMLDKHAILKSDL